MGVDTNDRLSITALRDDNFLYKLEKGAGLETFLSCEYAKYYFTEKDDDGGQLLDNRNCTACARGQPFSYGYNEKTCKSCGDLAGFIDNADPYLQYFYNEGC